MITGFAPIIYPESTILILGSMPSIASLQQQQYYGYKHNAFWWIISRMVGEHTDNHCEASYPQKLLWIKQLKLSVWDVFSDCEREGSLDSAINLQSARLNDFEQLFENYPNIKAILFNGRTAEQQFKKSVDASITQDIKLTLMPSTSPANARISKLEKFQLWQQAYQEMSLSIDGLMD